MRIKTKHELDNTRGIYLRNLTYWLRFYRNGREIRKSLNTGDMSEAIKLAKAERARVPMNPAENLQGSVGRYLKQEVESNRLAPRYAEELRRRLGFLLDHFPEVTRLDDLTPKRLQAYLDHVRRKLSPASLNSYSGQLRGLFNILVERNHLRENPMNYVRLPAFNQGEHVRENTVSPETAQKLIDNCRDHRLRFVLLAGFCMGMRKEEIIEARWGWFNEKARV